MVEENKIVEKPKKHHTGLIAILTLIAGLLIGVGGSYYYFEVYQKDLSNTTNKKDEKEKTTSTQEISTDSIYLKELIENYDMSYIGNTDIYTALYSKDKTNVTDLNEEYLRAITIKKANKTIMNTLSVSGEEFQNAVKQLFGNQITLENKSFSIANGCTQYNYSNNYYSIDPNVGGCGGTTATTMDRVITKVAKKDANLTVEVAIAILNGMDNKVYKSYQNNNCTDEVVGVAVDNFDINNNVNNLNKYKYVFTYDEENDGYYLNYIELVK